MPIEHPQYYTEEVKNILINYFISDGLNSKKNFNNYYDDFISTYATMVSEDKRVVETINPNTKKVVIQQSNWIYSTQSVLWNNEKNDNLITFLISQEQFDFSNTKLNNINKLRPNWNHINHDGNNALHLLFKRKQFNEDLTATFINKYAVDPCVINNEGRYFSYPYTQKESFLYQYTTNGNDKNLIHDIDHLVLLSDILKHYPEHFSTLSINDIKTIKEDLQEVSDNIFTFIQDNDNIFNLKAFEEKKSIIQQFHKYLDSLYHYHCLQQTLPVSYSTPYKKIKV